MRCELMKLLTCQVEESADEADFPDGGNKIGSIDSTRFSSTVDVSQRGGSLGPFNSGRFNSSMDQAALQREVSNSLHSPLSATFRGSTRSTESLSVVSGAVSVQNLGVRPGAPSEATLDRAFSVPSGKEDGGKGASNGNALQRTISEGLSDAKTLSPAHSWGRVAGKLGVSSMNLISRVATASTFAGDVEITVSPSHGDAQDASTPSQPTNLTLKQISEATEVAASDLATPTRGALDSGGITVTADVVSVGDVHVHSNDATPGGGGVEERPGGSC
jgi:hypothetical protein